MQGICSADVRESLPNSCWVMGQWHGSYFSFSRAGKWRQNISRLALEGFQDSFALASSARNRRHSENHIPAKRPLLHHLSFTACLFPSLPFSVPKAYTNPPGHCWGGIHMPSQPQIKVAGIEATISRRNFEARLTWKIRFWLQQLLRPLKTIRISGSDMVHLHNPYLH